MHTRESNAYCLGVFDYGSSGTLIGGITFRDTLVQVIIFTPFLFLTMLIKAWLVRTTSLLTASLVSSCVSERVAYLISSCIT